MIAWKPSSLSCISSAGTGAPVTGLRPNAPTKSPMALMSGFSALAIDVAPPVCTAGTCSTADNGPPAASPVAAAAGAGAPCAAFNSRTMFSSAMIRSSSSRIFASWSPACAAGAGLVCALAQTAQSTTGTSSVPTPARLIFLAKYCAAMTKACGRKVRNIAALHLFSAQRARGRSWELAGRRWPDEERKDGVARRGFRFAQDRYRRDRYQHDLRQGNVHRRARMRGNTHHAGSACKVVLRMQPVNVHRLQPDQQREKNH